MEVCHTIAHCRELRAAHQRLALVPTMGALHEGHLSLIRLAKEHAPSVAVSIFVNPTQFGPREDFNGYPRPIEQDIRRCQEAEVDLVFQPGVEEMYRPGLFDVAIDLPQLTSTLEGKHRPGHFNGVCQIVAKLFHIISPQVSVFGQKDYQQLRVISAMVQTLDWPIEIVSGATVREGDGLAMSSRNHYLSPDERQRALSIPRSLRAAEAEVNAGVRQTNRLETLVRNMVLDPGKLGRIPVSIDYVAAVDPQTLRPVETVEAPTLLAVAARVGTTRLIDNVIVHPM